MCKQGISVLTEETGKTEEKGRASNIRFDEKTGKIVCDFKGDCQKKSRIVNIKYIKGINKKSNKKLTSEILALEKKLFPSVSPAVAG